MAATLEIVELNGDPAAKTETVITEARYGTADMVDPLQAGTANFYTVHLPSTGTRSTYWKSHALRASGTFTDIRNIVWYASVVPAWALGTGGGMLIGNRDTGDIGVPDASYQQAAGVQDEYGYDIEDATNWHAYFNTQTTPIKNWSDWTDAAPATVDSTYYTAAFTSKHVVTQIRFGADANNESMSGAEWRFRARVVS